MEDRLEEIKKKTKLIEGIDTVLHRIKLQKARAKEKDYFMFSGWLTKLFQKLQPSLTGISTPEELDMEVLILVEKFYKDKKRELEDDIINIR